MNRHHISRIRTVAPEPEGMTEFMQRRGLQHRSSEVWGNQHRHLRFETPCLLTTHLQQLQQTAAVTGSPATTHGFQGGLAPLQQHMGSIGRVHPLQVNNPGPLIECRLHRGAPALFPTIRHSRGRGLHPDTPVRQGRPAQRGRRQRAGIARQSRPFGALQR